MNPARLRIEQTILERHFPRRFAFEKKDAPSDFALRLGLRCNSGRTYQIRLRIPPDYPSSMPRAYVMTPEDLRDHGGRRLVQHSPSHDMHLLSPEGNQIQLCHYRLENWHANVTLYRVALKCLVWLEAYENHLLSGRPLTHYLRS